MNKETNWWMIVAIVALVLLLFSGSGMIGFGGFGCGSYSSGYSGGMMSWMFGNSGYVFGPFMIIGVVIAWGIAIMILVYFIKMITHSVKNEGEKIRRKRLK